jgi:hypothetical protein
MVEMKIGDAKADDAMDWLTFISSIVGSIAWPIAAFAIAYLFRLQIKALLSRIKTLRMGDNAVDFGEKLEEAEAVAGAVAVAEPVAEATIELGPVTQQPPATRPFPTEHTVWMENRIMPAQLRGSAEYAILAEWHKLEAEVHEIAEPLFKNSLLGERRPPFRSVARALLAEGIISSGTHSLLVELQELRNTVVHNPQELTRVDAIRFSTLAEQAHQMLAVERSNPIDRKSANNGDQ